MYEVSANELTRRFGDIVAVDNMTLDVPQGSIFGLLGPNGAGKSTTVRLLCTLLRPDAGTATVSGHDIIKEPVAVRQTTGVLPEEGNHTLYPTMTAMENLEYFARLYGVPEEEIRPRIQELLEFMGLWERRDDLAGALSTGNRQRLALCRALLHKPTVLLLDEPTSALDPLAAKRVRELILSLSQKYGQTFFINSHNLAEVQRICDRIAIIDKGKILLMGSTEELRRELSSEQVFRIRVYGDVARAESIVRSQEYVLESTVEVDTVVVKISDPLENNSRLMSTLLNAGIKIVEFAEEEATLEDVYLRTIKGGDQ
ncbi:MAG: ABC transporter ATP-binding protein [Candidatus Thorarchaeota archaeon]|nr:ABC transporter ATP-binding protein [Candidatus Thorarchaeota archaeon]